MANVKKINWQQLLKIIIVESPKAEILSFGGCKFLFKYVGRKQDRMGYLLIWEIETKQAISFSRLKVPEQYSMIDIDNIDDLLSQVPSNLIFESLH